MGNKLAITFYHLEKICSISRWFAFSWNDSFFRAPTDLLLRNPFIGVFRRLLLPPSCFLAVFVTIFFDFCLGDFFYIATSISSGATLINNSLSVFFRSRENKPLCKRYSSTTNNSAKSTAALSVVSRETRK